MAAASMAQFAGRLRGRRCRFRRGGGLRRRGGGRLRLRLARRTRSTFALGACRILRARLDRGRVVVFLLREIVRRRRRWGVVGYRWLGWGIAHLGGRRRRISGGRGPSRFGGGGSPGAAFWTPRGTVLYNTLEQFVRERQRADFLEVKTPLLYTKQLWEQSGHWGKYRENMFLVLDNESGEHDMSLKPMNCPSHYLYYASETHSYERSRVFLPAPDGRPGGVHGRRASGPAWQRPVPVCL